MEIGYIKKEKMKNMQMWEDLEKALAESRECKTVFLEDEYKYMVFYCLYDKRKGQYFPNRELITLDHEFYEEDYREFEMKKENYDCTCTITGVNKEPLV